MQIMKRILVCLDRGKMDEHVIQYAALMADVLQSQRVYFIHVVKDVGSKSDPFKEPMTSDQHIVKEIDKLILEHFKSKVETKVVVKKGNSVKKIIRFAHLNRIELIILGKKPLEESTKTHTAKVTNSSRCSVLLVPSKASCQLKKVMVPLDFSVNSRMALTKTMEIKQNHDFELMLQHVYFVPTGYHASGKSYEEFAEIMERNARNEYKKFMKGNEFEIDQYEMFYTLDDDSKPSDRIYKIGSQQGVDLIILASRGRTPAAALLLGSTAVGLIKYNDDIPYLIVKDKKENMGIFEAIGKL